MVAWTVFGVFLLVALVLITRWTVKPPNLRPRRGRPKAGTGGIRQAWTAGENTGSGDSCGGGSGGGP